MMFEQPLKMRCREANSDINTNVTIDSLINAKEEADLDVST